MSAQCTTKFCKKVNCSEEDIVLIKAAGSDLRKVYHRKVSDKVAQVVKQSIKQMSKYFTQVFADFSDTGLEEEDEKKDKDVVFILQACLNIPNIEVQPSLDEVQAALNAVGRIMISVGKGISLWKHMHKKSERSTSYKRLQSEKGLYKPVKKEKPKIAEKPYNLYKVISDNKDVTKAFTNLQKCLIGMKLEWKTFCTMWDSYTKLWMVDKEEFIESFSLKKPTLKDVEDEIHEYKMLESQLSTEKNEYRIGVLLVSTVDFKLVIQNEIKQWINIFTRAIHERYRKDMLSTVTCLADLDKKLERQIKDLDDIRLLMETLKKIRNIEIDLDMKIDCIEEAYSVIVKHDLQLTKEEVAKVESISENWLKIQNKAVLVQTVILDVKEHFKSALLHNLDQFRKACDNFVENYHKHGPMEANLSVREVSDRLMFFQNQFDSLWRQHTSYIVGAQLFGILHEEHEGLDPIRKELNLLQRLYKLYNDVIESVAGYNDLNWADVNVEDINNDLVEFSNRCRKLPKALKEWPAFHALKKIIDDFNDVCPIIELMSNKAMKYRHWDKIQKVIKYKFSLENKSFPLKNVLDAPLMTFKDEIEDICISAVKEKEIESKLKQIATEWTSHELHFQIFKHRGELLLKGESTSETISLVEDSLLLLSSLMSNRYNLPFLKQIQKWQADLSGTNEILERWLLVQNMWVYLEAVFVGGDIAKQLPKEAKRFYKIDKTWQRIMQKAHDISSVVYCCIGDDYLKKNLPFLQEQLELCQKSLTGYLEKKRLVFPRFFFVSDTALLEVLGQASDSHTIQAHLLSIFDNTANVRFHEQDYNKILAIVSSEDEVVPLEAPVRAEGSVEVWLGSLLKAAQESLHGIIRQAFHFINDPGFELLEFIKKFQAQVGILGIQMIWTREAENALLSAKTERKIMTETNNKFLEMLNTFIGETTKDISKMARTKFETLITVHMHQRDIFDTLVKNNCKNAMDFEWLKQARFYFKLDLEKTLVCITDVNFYYQNEYLGCQDRLVITPLTDRCYITLSQALGLCMGGAPAGPAGTGKTETVKDLGKTLGKYVVVFNCSDQMDYKGLGRIYKGLAQSGSWGCFDEFNRIALPVLSVAAQQIAIVLGCKKEKQKTFIFSDGEEVEMNPEFGIFITMNPTYKGRVDLPENMKNQFRNVAMMVPDRQIIIRVKLASCGFHENVTLARKFFCLYKLCEEQLTKQVHYDFGLRNILSVLRTLGSVKRASPRDSEMTTVMRVLRDMNTSKLVDDDEPLFASLLNDLFPNSSIEKTGYPELEEKLKEVVEENGLEFHGPWVEKVIQIYEAQKVRHGIMVLGPSGTGKSTSVKMLKKTLNLTGSCIKEMRLNPKSISDSQMFGKLDVATNDWTDGIFSALWRKTLKENKTEKERHWLVLDGPVDPNWIENLNSVLDDNKTLTLANGDRLPMLPTVKLIFEPQNIDNASPATVSRNAMVYMSSSGLDWEPLLESWLKVKNVDGTTRVVLKQLFDGTFQAIYKWAETNLNFVISFLKVNLLTVFFMILEALLPCFKNDIYTKKFVQMTEVIYQEEVDENEDQEAEDEEEEELVEETTQQIDTEPKNVELGAAQTYIFALLWAFGSFLEEPERLKLESFVKNIQGITLPTVAPNETVYNYMVNPYNGTWVHWNEKLNSFNLSECTVYNFNTILVPNLASIRTKFFIECARSLERNVALIGESGCTKTHIINDYLRKSKSDSSLLVNFNFSATTSPQSYLRGIETTVEKKAGSVYGPPAGKLLTVFVDDVNLPEINEWGDQTTNEFFRQLIEMKGYYSLEKPGDFIQLVDLSFMTAMCHPGGGRNDVPQRFKRHFVYFNCTRPTNDDIDRIYSTISDAHFNEKQGFKKEICSMVKELVPLTRKLWQEAKQKLLPTPAKFHYIFNIRDLSRVWQGKRMFQFYLIHIFYYLRFGKIKCFCKTDFEKRIFIILIEKCIIGMIGTLSSVIATEIQLLQLWRHETLRVICDRLTNDNDLHWFEQEFAHTLEENFPSHHQYLLHNEAYFVDFLRDAPEPTGEEDDNVDMEVPKIYEAIESFESLECRLRYFMSQYNEYVRGNNMDLVFFKDAMLHLIKISRVIRNPGGNIMLIGVGGSGKQSLTKLASFIAGYNTFQITMTRSYNLANFIEDLKNLFRLCGTQGKGTAFLFTDQDIKEETFLEYINNILISGIVSNIFSKDEQHEIVNELTPVMKRDCAKQSPSHENVMSWFTERVKKFLHVVLCFSPVGEKLRSRALKFPGLISGCTVDWFQAWPKSALVSVASHFLSGFEIQCNNEMKKNLFTTIATVQDDVSTTCLEYYERYRRQTHVTPKSFLSFLNMYKHVYSRKEEEIGELSARMNIGLHKLDGVSTSVEVLKRDLVVMEKNLETANEKAEDVLKSVTQRAKDAEQTKEQVIIKKVKAEKLVAEVQVKKGEAEEMLAAAKPALDEAVEALNTIKPANIATVRKLGHPPHLIMRIMDCTLILFKASLPLISPDPTVPCPKPSWSDSLKLMSSATFLSQLLNFPKDTINDEIVELLEPYFTMEDYNMETAVRVCGDVAGLLCWTKAMAFFFGVNKEVLPLKQNVFVQESRLKAAQKDLLIAQLFLKKKEKELKKVQQLYSDAVQKKQKLKTEADNCNKKMVSAKALINGLAGEKTRWTLQSKAFKSQLFKLIGDTLLACSFLSFSGPFNQEFRNQLMRSWKALLTNERIPFTSDIDVVSMLVNGSESSESALQGLPTDELSLQNATIVTKARCFPLLVDPQGQGKLWIRSKEQENDLQVTNLNHKYFRVHLEDSLSLGRPLLIEDIGEELDPILDNLLEKNYIPAGRGLKVLLGDQEIDVVDGFMLYITTKNSNPAYTPEISAKCAIIDFTVTMKGLEDQLLGRVIRMEKSELESEKIKLFEEVLENKATMKELEDNLLEKLSSVKGSIIEDHALISVLRETKNTADDVSAKIRTAGETEKKINAAREEFRKVANRGSILYFLIVEMAKMNVMYQTSLRQFLVLFDQSVTKSKPTHVTEKRINHIIDYLTRSVWRYTSRGLYEGHKFLFTLLLALKLDLNDGVISNNQFQLLLKGGASLDMNSTEVNTLHFYV